MKIRTKILLGFLILAVMLAAAGAYSIYELTSLSASVQKLLDDNYKSITASKQMIEALEREDSGILLLLSGKWKEGRSTIVDADENFKHFLAVAGNNVTIPGEKNFIEKIHAAYNVYRSNWDRPIVGTDYEGNLNWYFEKVHREFNEAKEAVQELMALNDKVMYQTASNLKNRARRAIMPGIVALSSALVFSLVFNFFVNLYIVNPILQLIQSIKNFLRSGQPVKLDIETKDELRDLADSIVNLSRLARIPEKDLKVQ
jgi:methyl-accepting chemotaxis protein